MPKAIMSNATVTRIKEKAAREPDCCGSGLVDEDNTCSLDARDLRVGIVTQGRMAC